MKGFFFVLSWFLLLMATMLVSTAAYSVFALAQEEKQKNLVGEYEIGDSNLITNGKKEQSVVAILETEDARDAIVARFLERHKSPMQPYEEYGRKIVEISDRYQIDFRLLPAIAMQESNLCRNTNPNAPGNCLGFGIHKSGTLDFDSYEAGFERAGRELKAYYIDKGLTTVEQIERKYTPSSNGSWAASVNQWMAEMRFDDRQLGREMKQNTSATEFATVEEATTSAQDK
jgi:hypothetical protein